MKRQKTKKNIRGITLIALVITIVVLLILVGVSIATLTGDNGILTRTNQAKEETEKATEKEQIQLALIEYEMDSSENDKYTLIEKETNQKILNKTEENVLNGEIIELENGRKYLITDNNVEYIEGIENAVLMSGYIEDISWWKNNKLVGQDDIAREQIEEVHIINNKNISEDAEFMWDISENQDGSVVSWVTDADKDNLYEWYIGANYRIKANQNMMNYFSHLINCTKIDGLEYLDLSETKTIMNLFSNDTKLTQLDLNSWDTKNITSMSAIFSGCVALEKVDLTAWNTSKVVIMSEMFYNCENLKEINLNNFDTKQVRSMARMFANCKLLEKVELNNFDTSNVNDMDSMFRYIQNLKELNLSSFNTDKVENFNSMFFDNKIEELDISKLQVNEDPNYKNFLNNSNKNIKVYVKNVEMNNKILEDGNSNLSESNIFIK